MSRLKLFELPSALEPRIRSSEPNRWFSIWIMLSLRDDATQLFELSFFISYPSCAIIMLRLFCHSLLSSLNFFLCKLEPEDSLLFSGLWFLCFLSVLFSLLWLEDCSNSVGLFLDKSEMFTSDRFFFLALDSDRLYPNFLTLRFAAVFAFLTDASSSELDEKTTANF